MPVRAEGKSWMARPSQKPEATPSLRGSAPASRRARRLAVKGTRRPTWCKKPASEDSRSASASESDLHRLGLSGPAEGVVGLHHLVQLESVRDKFFG